MDATLKEAYHAARQGATLLSEEVESWKQFSVPLDERVSLWQRGFLSRANAIYDFEEYDSRAYLSDYERYVKTRTINGAFGIALDNKLLFHHVLEGFDEHRPTLHGMIDGGRLRPIADGSGRTADGTTTNPDGSGPFSDRLRPIPDGSGSIVGEKNRSRTPDGPEAPTEPTLAIEWLEEELSPGDRVVSKWVLGGGGHNVKVIERTGDGFTLNGSEFDRRELAAELADVHDHLLTEFVEQAPYADELYPDAANTIRLVTMRDPDSDEAFVGAAIHRVGTDDSAPMDNWTAGGLSAPIDRETGRMGTAIAYPAGEELVRHDFHPDTGAQIDGATVTEWESIRERVLEIADALHYVSYAGWDLIVTEDGFRIIEANNYPGVKSIQVHGPLMDDPRVQRFYEAHGVR